MTTNERKRNPVGTTDLIGASHISKADRRIQVIGAIDEAGAALALAKSFMSDDSHKQILTNCQQDLYTIMAGIAHVKKSDTKPDETIAGIDLALSTLEATIEQLEKTVVMPKTFIVSGDSPASGALAFARTVVRRAERDLKGLAEKQGNISDTTLQYLNRLSSLCFLLELAQTTNPPITIK